MEFVFLLIIIVAATVLAHWKGGRKTNSAWRKIARDLGLVYLDTGKPSLTGHYDNRAVKIKIRTGPPGNSSPSYTDFEVEYRKPIRADFQLGRKGLPENRKGMVGAKDIETGDPGFDGAVRLRGRHEADVKKFFQSEETRETCMNLIGTSRYTQIKITNYKIAVSVAGKMMNSSEIKTVLDHLIGAAALLEAAESKPSPKNERPKPPPLPRSAPKVSVPEEWHGTEPANVEPPEPPILEERKAQVAEPEPELASADESIDAPAEILPPPDFRPDGDSLSIDEVAEELFQEGLGKYQAGKCFDDLFKGETAHWKGRLKGIFPGDSDRHWGRGSGWIALFELGTFPGMERGAGLLAKYRIGREKMEAFSGGEGTAREIRGELTKFDPFAATLYIDSGDPPEGKSSPAGASKFVSYADRMKKEMQSPPGEVRRFPAKKWN